MEAGRNSGEMSNGGLSCIGSIGRDEDGQPSHLLFSLACIYVTSSSGRTAYQAIV